MKTHSTSMLCPSCGGVMEPVVLACTGCELRLEGRFAANEFARLTEDDLHFLRIFVHCDGRIRDMESALGVSYPTIKARLAGLKSRLRAGAAGHEPKQNETQKPTTKTSTGPTAEILANLESGKITAEEAAQALRGPTRTPNQPEKGDQP